MQNIWQHIYAAFIEADRWKLYLKGLGVTLEVSFFAALLGILIGTIAAFLKRIEDHSVPDCKCLY